MAFEPVYFSGCGIDVMAVSEAIKLCFLPK